MRDSNYDSDESNGEEAIDLAGEPDAVLLSDEVDHPESEAFVEANANLVSTPAPDNVFEWDFAIPSEDVQLHIQAQLRRLGLYPGKLNGAWSKLSICAIQASVGLKQTGDIDKQLCIAVRRYVDDLDNMSSTNEAAATLNADYWDTFALALDGKVK